MRTTKDRRITGALLTAVLVLLGGLGIGWIDATHPPDTIDKSGASAHHNPELHASQARQTELRLRFDTAARMLRAGQYQPAADTLRRVLVLEPEMPEAHVNMGFAMLGLRHARIAREHFDRATTLNASQANAYYGLALAHESGGDLELAMGAMRTYLHLARAEDEAHLRRARAALWEWETQRAARRTAARP